MFPLKNYRGQIPPGDEGSFGKVRESDVHTGVDLHCPEGTPVYAIEDGVVVAVDDFTGVEESGPDAEYGYLYTQAVMVEGHSGVVTYGEVVPSVKKGNRVKEGDEMGLIANIFPLDYKGPCPSVAMLHFELYKPSTKITTWWNKGEDQPESLLDPTSLLRELL